jgi:hypothetical protein
MAEEWRDIPGWEGLYQASSLGNIRSLERTIDHGRGKRKLRSVVLAQDCSCARYRQVKLTSGPRRQTRTVHSLVCAAFHGDRPDEMVAAHLDGDGANNAASNLKWVTQMENVRHSKIHGTFSDWRTQPGTKLDGNARNYIRRVKSIDAVLARLFGVSPSLIHRIRNT